MSIKLEVRLATPERLEVVLTHAESYLAGVPHEFCYEIDFASNWPDSVQDLAELSR
jgi:hypothetical protein